MYILIHFELQSAGVLSDLKGMYLFQTFHFNYNYMLLQQLKKAYEINVIAADFIKNAEVYLVIYV